MKYSHIFWDWNGTLFNDVDWCIDVMNVMLRKRGIKTLGSLSEYQKVFCFPIVQYYRNVGFDFEAEPFETLAAEFITGYHAENDRNCTLCDCAESILQEIHRMAIKQVILSASEINNLAAQMDRFDIREYFDEVLGITDIFAKSKIDLGLDFIARNQINRALLIGDTVHDCETAQALGADCLLIANGHQSKETLLSCNVPVLDDISHVLEFMG